MTLALFPPLQPLDAWPRTYPTVPGGWTCPSCGYRVPEGADADGTKSHGPYIVGNDITSPTTCYAIATGYAEHLGLWPPRDDAEAMPSTH